MSVTKVRHGPTPPFAKLFQKYCVPRWYAGYDIPFAFISANIAYWPWGPCGIRLLA